MGFFPVWFPVRENSDDFERRPGGRGTDRDLEVRLIGFKDCTDLTPHAGPLTWAGWTKVVSNRSTLNFPRFPYASQYRNLPAPSPQSTPSKTPFSSEKLSDDNETGRTGELAVSGLEIKLYLTCLKALLG